MSHHLQLAMHHTARAAGSFASQVAIAVATGVCVALITNTILAKSDESDAASQPPASMESAAAAPLPALQPIVIEDVPAPLSRAPAEPLLPVSGGLFYATAEPPADALLILETAAAAPPPG